jgi:hypothetical protein
VGEKRQTLSVGTVVLTMAQGDLTGDGNADLVLGSFSGQITILLGRGDGTFTPSTTLQVNGLEDLAVVDIDGNGTADLVVPIVSANKVSTFLGRGDGTFAPPIDSEVNPTPAALWPQTFVVALAVGEVDSDGRPDLAVSGGTDNCVYIMIGDGKGRFSTIEKHPNLIVPRALGFADLNRTGRPDLIVAGFGPEVSVLSHS